MLPLTPPFTISCQCLFDRISTVSPINFRRRTIFRSFSQNIDHLSVFDDFKVSCNDMATGFISKLRFVTFARSGTIIKDVRIRTDRGVIKNNTSSRFFITVTNNGRFFVIKTWRYSLINYKVCVFGSKVCVFLINILHNIAAVTKNRTLGKNHVFC